VPKRGEPMKLAPPVVVPWAQDAKPFALPKFWGAFILKLATRTELSGPICAPYRCKCPARTPLVFAYAGDPAREPAVPAAAEPAPARWHANCAGCGTVHRRARRPKAGVWRCRCPARGELKWAFGPGEPG
jgi:hypothetical protein